MTGPDARRRTRLLAVEKSMRSAPHILTVAFAMGLIRIENEELWRATSCASFEDYCLKEWGLEPAGVSRIMKRSIG